MKATRPEPGYNDTLGNPVAEEAVGHLEGRVLVSCEHASNRLPAPLRLDAELLKLHIAWDPGARQIARRLAKRFGAPLWEGEVSRLVVDLNRTLGNRVLMRRVSDGHPIPFNRGLTEAERRQRLERYYLPYRRAVECGVRQIISKHGRCVHLCVHTFTPQLAGRRRGNDIGLLHDPKWGIERQVCAEIRHGLDQQGEFVVWFNRPYSGTADGILPAMRALLDPAHYVGLEIEVNQKFAGNAGALRRIADELAEAIAMAPSLA